MHTISRAAVEPPSCLFSNHPACSCGSRAIAQTIPGRKMQANKRVCPLPGALAGCPTEQGVNRRQPRGTGQKGWLRRSRVGGCKAGTQSSGTDMACPGSHSWGQQTAAELVSIKFCVQVNEVFQFLHYN